MKSPSFTSGLVFAFLAAVLSSMVFTLLPGLLAPGDLVRLLIAALGLAYALYLLRYSGRRAGRVVAIAAWTGLALSAWFLATAPLSYLALHLGAIWLLRALYFQAGALAALADLVLNIIALMGGLWAYLHSGSIFLGVWSFFLVQALFVTIPTIGRNATAEAPDPFAHAHHSAESALRRLVQNR